MRNDGNALLITLFTVMILAMLLAAQAVVTRANVVTVERRTTGALLGATTTLHTPARLRVAAANLPAFLSTQLSAGTTPTQLTSTTTLASWQRALDDAWAQCRAGRFQVNVHLAGQASCGQVDPGAAQRNTVTKNTLSATGLTEYRIPLYVRATAVDTSGARRTRQATGEAVILGMTSMPVNAYQLLTGTLQADLPAGIILDGPVHVNAGLRFEAGQSAFLSRVTSGASALTLGGQSRTPDTFAPSPSLPCDPKATTCPTFGDGLSLQAGTVSIPHPSVASLAAINLPGNVREVVLNPHPSGGTEVYACTTADCTRYWFQPQGTGWALWQHSLTSPVPPRNGLVFQPPEPETGSPWTAISSGVRPVILAPTNLQVRALYPSGGAYQGVLTVAANQTLTVTSSLRAASPVCDSYPVRDTQGALRPASCTNGSTDQLGLISQQGNIDLGDSTLSLAESETSMAVHAALLASRGAVALRDTRLSTFDLTGSVASATFTPDSRMRLAFDPRVPTLPAFPTMASSTMPPAVLLQGDSEQDVP